MNGATSALLAAVFVGGTQAAALWQVGGKADPWEFVAAYASASIVSLCLLLGLFFVICIVHRGEPNDSGKGRQ